MDPARNRTQHHELWKFHGGLHLDDHKAESTRRPISAAAIPSRLILPLQQHIGEPAEPIVRVGDKVLAGQLIARPSAMVSAAVHAPSSGTVFAIENQPIPHPSGLTALSICIDTDGEHRRTEGPPCWESFAERTPEELVERIRWAGIVGMGGAAFPSSVKLNPAPSQPIETLILNGAECEPYITCDDMLMRERAAAVIDGAAILIRVLGASQCLIGIEDNKPEAIGSLDAEVAKRADTRIQVVSIPTLYPSGGERQLIRILTGKEVPSNGLPASIGVVCHNVATAAAAADAVVRGRPLTSRIVTLTGAGIKEPRNVEVLIGTPIRDVIDQFGGYTPEAHRLIVGGPMMGFALDSDSAPVTKAANCLFAASRDEAPDPGPALPCIRCGECAKVCPALLLPQQLYWYSRAKDFEQAQDYHLFDCIECGCCSYVCPSHIPLVQFFRYAKTESWATERERAKAERARQRHEAREARLRRLEEERKAKLRMRKEDLQKEKGRDGDNQDKKAAIAAAIARAAAKKAARAESSAEGEAPPRRSSPSRTEQPPSGTNSGESLQR